MSETISHCLPISSQLFKRTRTKKIRMKFLLLVFDAEMRSFVYLALEKLCAFCARTRHNCPGVAILPRTNLTDIKEPINNQNIGSIFK